MQDQRPWPWFPERPLLPCRATSLKALSGPGSHGMRQASLWCGLSDGVANQEPGCSNRSTDVAFPLACPPCPISSPAPLGPDDRQPGDR